MTAAANKRTAASPDPRQSARDAYRQAIREAAEREFVRSGFAAARMTRVARAAGVAVGTLYNYFESKEEIFEEMLAHRCAEMRARTEQRLAGGTPRENLGALVRSTLENLEQHGALFALLVERGGVAEYDLERLGGRASEQEYQRYLSLMTDVLRAAVQAGELRGDIPLPTLVAALSGAINGSAYAWFRRRRRGRLAAVAADVLELFLSGAGKKR